jgi:IS30 family transposase
MGQEDCNTGTKKYQQITEKERYRIEGHLRAGLRPAAIALLLGRDRRNIEREIKKGTVEQMDSELRKRWVYCADAGQRVHDQRAKKKGRGIKIGHDHALADYLEEKIGVEKWSPDAAIGAIKANGLQFAVTLCTKTVYNMIDRGDFLTLTNESLPVKRDKKKQAYKRVRSVALNNLKGRSIEERPEDIELREELGHWEMDLVVGSGHACLLVLTERRSRHELIWKIPSKEQKHVIAVLDRLERKLGRKFREVFKSITMDNGSEFLDMEGIERSVFNPREKRTTCYYAHPYSAYERGSNENTNKLIRRFVPKGSDIDKLTLKAVARIQHWINNYPRRIFGYLSSIQFEPIPL